MIVDPHERCKPRYSAKCASKKGWPIAKEVVEYSKERWFEVICYTCQKEMKAVGLLK